MFPDRRPHGVRVAGSVCVPRESNVASRIDRGLVRTKANHHPVCAFSAPFDGVLYVGPTGALFEHLGRVAAIPVASEGRRATHPRGLDGDLHDAEPSYLGIVAEQVWAQWYAPVRGNAPEP